MIPKTSESDHAGPNADGRPHDPVSSGRPPWATLPFCSSEQDGDGSSNSRKRPFLSRFMPKMRKSFPSIQTQMIEKVAFSGTYRSSCGWYKDCRSTRHGVSTAFETTRDCAIERRQGNKMSSRVVDDADRPSRFGKERKKGSKMLLSPRGFWYGPNRRSVTMVSRESKQQIIFSTIDILSPVQPLRRQFTTQRRHR